MAPPYKLAAAVTSTLGVAVGARLLFLLSPLPPPRACRLLLSARLLLAASKAARTPPLPPLRQAP
ncbi:hypothetical protein ABZP36_019656 [Zizania latifolia]